MRGKVPRGEMWTPKKELASKHFYEALAKLHYLQAAANCIEGLGNQGGDMSLRNVGGKMFNLIEEIMEDLGMVLYHGNVDLDFYGGREPGAGPSEVVRDHTANLNALMENAPGAFFASDKRTIEAKTGDLMTLSGKIRKNDNTPPLA